MPTNNKEYWQSYYANNREKIISRNCANSKAKLLKFKQDNPELIAARVAARREALEIQKQQTKLHAADVTAAWRAANADKIKVSKAEYYQRNKDKQAAYYVEYREKNADAIKAYFKLYKVENKHKIRARGAARNAKKYQATPSWLTAEQRAAMADIFLRASNRTKETGVLHEVDHIYPIRGKTVCGLHVPWNLQILPHDENRSKSNLMPEDFYGISTEDVAKTKGYKHC